MSHPSYNGYHQDPRRASLSHPQSYYSDAPMPPFQGHHYPQTPNWRGALVSPAQFLGVPSPPNSLPPRAAHDQWSTSFRSPSTIAPPFIPHHRAPLPGHHDQRSHTHLHSPSVDHRSISPLSAASSNNRAAHSSGGNRRNRRTDDPDGLRPKYKPRVGGPPKAKLGGPGGKTYDEMAAEAIARKASAEASPGTELSAPLLDNSQETRGETGGEGKQAKEKANVEEKPSKWRGKPIGFKPPPTRYSPPSSPPRMADFGSPSDLPGSSEGTDDIQVGTEEKGKKRHVWPERNVRTSANGIPLPPSPPPRVEKFERPLSEAAWGRLKPSTKSSEISHQGISAATVPLPESDADEPTSPRPVPLPSGHRSGGSVDFFRAHAIREPPTRDVQVDAVEQSERVEEVPPTADQDQPLSASSTSTSSETHATPLRRTGAFVGNAAFLRKQLGGVLRSDRAAPSSQPGRMSTSDGARRVLLESNIKVSAASQNSVNVEVEDIASSNYAGDVARDVAELVEVPLTASADTSTLLVPAEPTSEVGVEEVSVENTEIKRQDAITKEAGEEVVVDDHAQTEVSPNAGEEDEEKEGEESPVSRAMRLIQSSLTSSRSSQSTSGKRKQGEMGQGLAESPEPSPTKSSTLQSPTHASRIDRASIGPKMGRYLQGQLSGFLKPKGQRSRPSCSPGTVLHGLDVFATADMGHAATPSDTANEAFHSADQMPESTPSVESHNAFDKKEENAHPPLGDGALGLFTFTSTLRPSAGTFKPATAARLETGSDDDERTIRKKPALRPTAPSFAPVGPRPPARRDSVASSDTPHKRLRGDAPTFNPSASGHTSRQSFASTHQSVGLPVAMAFASPAKSNTSLQLRPSATAFVPSHFAQSSISSLAPPSPRASISGAAPVDWDATVRRGSTREPADIFFASKALRADATSFVPSELPLSPTSGKRTLSSSTLKALESWLEKASTGTHTPAIGSLAPSTAVSPRFVDPRPLEADNEGDISANSPAGSRPSSPALGDLSVTTGRRDLTRSAAPSPDSRRPLPQSVPAEVVGGEAEAEATVDSNDLFYRPPVESDETASADDVISPNKDSLPGQVLYHSPPPLASPLAAGPSVSPPSSAPEFKQPEIKVDSGADDRRFRKWVFPVSPTGDRPPTMRRHTMPIHDQDPPALSPDAETTLSSRLEELRETLGRGLGKGKPRPPIPFSGVADDEVERKLEEMGMMLKDLQRRALERSRDALDVHELRLLLLELEGSILSALNDTNVDKTSAQTTELARIVSLLQDQAAAISTLQENSGVVADVHADIWTIDAAHKTALAELSAAQETAIASATANRSQATAEVVQLLEKMSAVEASQRGMGERIKEMVESQSALEDLQGRIRTLEQERSIALNDSAAVRQKMDLDEKRHRVVDSKLSSLKSKLEGAEAREAEVRKDWEEVLAGKMAAERARDELAEAMVVHIETMRTQRDEIARLAREFELEKSKPPPPPPVNHAAEKMDEMQKAFSSLQRDFAAQFASLSISAEERATAKDAESARLAQQNEQLHSQVADLRDQLDALRAEKSDERLRSRGELQSARSEIDTLRVKLQQANAACQSAESKAIEAEETTKRVTEELLDSRMIARDRQAACRMNEVRLQALAQETHYWRHFALSYDRKEYRAFITQNPALLQKHQKGASPELKTPGQAQLHRSTDSETPTKRMAPILETPSLVHSSDSSLDL